MAKIYGYDLILRPLWAGILCEMPATTNIKRSFGCFSSILRTTETEFQKRKKKSRTAEMN